MTAKRKIKKRSRLHTYFVRGFMVLIAYALFVALPIKYLPLPGFRTAGESLDGGWRWGNISGCFSDVPVLKIVQTNGYLVLDGERDWHMFKNIELKSDGKYSHFSAKMYAPNKLNEKNPLIF